jgi:hypothetical protein
MLSREFIQALESCTKSKNHQAFGLAVRSEVITHKLYAPGKDADLSTLLEFVRRNFADQYLRASICEIRDFLVDHKFCERATNGELTFPINSICQSFLLTSAVESRNLNHGRPMQQTHVRGAKGSAEHNEKYKELPSQRKIIEIRDFWGQLKVFLAWWAIWNTIHQIVLDLCFAILLCNALGICTDDNVSSLKVLRMSLAVMTSIRHMNIRMNNQARKRWIAKHGNQ